MKEALESKMIFKLFVGFMSYIPVKSDGSIGFSYRLDLGSRVFWSLFLGFVRA